MKTIGAAKFREQCSALLDRLDSDGLVITKHGRPVARVVPYVPEEAVLVGCLQHKIEVRGAGDDGTGGCERHDILAWQVTHP